MKIFAKNKESMPKTLKELSIVPAYIYALTHWRTLKALARYLWIVICDFFLLQFTVKWGWRNIEIINVDHELDDKIPFTPSLAPVYLDFFNFWTRPLSLITTVSPKTACSHFAKMLTIMGDIYKQASSFYKYKMTTTHRPTASDYRDKNFDYIRRMDPHYLCVPSLHIAVVILTYSFFKKVFDEECYSDEVKARYNKELYDGAIEIGETVLYVKQHSVNCIPAAVYTVSVANPDLFSIEDAVSFMDDLFANQDNISEDAKKEINEHLHRLFEQLLLEGKYADHWLEPLKRWLHKYQTGEYK